ncbi:hypothetical protein BCV72DRAFT_220243 [Rhizopus microsporus var. microsporus]|uniref:Protein kinase domain-containing protein n=2 Tax=Rhizopus microsporus TaxID=58291 RepID=A0A2G4SML0_RHIZD|nr:uncharacterized protein RHIMIDRAFT_261447 [Rhizopus microsporus ATCC 52813]ORE11086.1 hypothetical protein BCV72DRAFT_220243 [Rhizopus microsporus var. microsporus]PHZ10004.1 hypothetical protein RHIMIDRAFT_261447 [Rhizopus microsporus ATCC 52813]
MNSSLFSTHNTITEAFSTLSHSYISKLKLAHNGLKSKRILLTHICLMVYIIYDDVMKSMALAEFGSAR